MRSPIPAFAFSAGVLLTLGAGESAAQSTPLQGYGDPGQHLSTPRPGHDMRDALRTLGAPPAIGPVTPDASVGSGRELSQRERQELLAPSRRETPSLPSWGSSRDRN